MKRRVDEGVALGHEMSDDQARRTVDVQRERDRVVGDPGPARHLPTRRLESPWAM